MANKTALVLGSTGLIGKHLLSLLLDDTRYSRVSSLTRRTTGVEHVKLTEQLIDLDEMAEYERCFSVDDVFCCLGTTMKKAGDRTTFEKIDRHYVFAAAKLAKSAGAKRFLFVSAVAGETKSSSFHLRIKGLLEEDVASLDLPFYRAVRPSLLLGDREEYRLGESMGAAVFKPLSGLLLGSLKKYRPIYGSEVAQAMVNLANDEPAHPFLDVRP
jgi:uncharacterized protein YbjT (DUF2867 family)